MNLAFQRIEIEICHCWCETGWR